jgi:hypothetical protein
MFITFFNPLNNHNLGIDFRKIESRIDKLDFLYALIFPACALQKFVCEVQ